MQLRASWTNSGAFADCQLVLFETIRDQGAADGCTHCDTNSYSVGNAVKCQPTGDRSNLQPYRSTYEQSKNHHVLLLCMTEA